MLEKDTYQIKEVDIARQLAEVTRDGVSVVPGFADAQMIEEAIDICHNLSGSAREYNLHGNHFYYFELSREDEAALSAIGDRIGAVVRAQAGDIAPLSSWNPNFFAVQAYGPESQILTHKDRPDYKTLIATLTIQGEADFTHFANGTETVWHTRPGDLVLLRADGLKPDAPDGGRIAHSASRPLTSDSRISIGFRNWPFYNPHIEVASQDI